MGALVENKSPNTPMVEKSHFWTLRYYLGWKLPGYS